jgi:dipeptidyl aminopeptidase/acylaminoacyl peptidase
MAGLRPIRASAGTIRRVVAIGSLSLCLGATPGPATKRPLVPDDIFALKDVADPRLSPDGRLVAYEVTSLDSARDAEDADIWISPLAGGEAIRLTTSPESETSPRFSPDGRFVAFLSERGGSTAQVWLIDPRGGEASRLTDIKGEISAFAWSPEGGRLALVVKDPAPDDAENRPQPIVIRRLKFKKDGEGYLGNLRRHIHVFDVKARTSFALTSGPYDDDEPVWSPDGRSIAFTSNRTPEPDGNENSDVFLIEARAGALPRRLTRSPGTDSAPAFSPDGQSIAFVAGPEPKDLWYGTLNLGLVAVTGGPETILTRELDRVVSLPRFSGDGRSIYFVVEEGGNSHLARMPAKGGSIERIVDGELDVQAFDVGKSGETVVLVSHPDRPFEVSVVSKGGLKRVSRVNDRFLEGIALGPVERYKARSQDGASIDSFLTRPPSPGQGSAEKKRLPAILWIHGGPNGQYATTFDLVWQMLASRGYAVIGANPRGSTGYGQAFSRAIYKDWGNKDYDDIMAAVDRAIAMGVADPERLGVGGWSYGGMLTDVVITKTSRFKAAIAGASEANAFANYGVDEYQYAWETEAGLPWGSVESWMHLSPWFQIDKVKTPTLFMGGAEDHNVPIINSEQLYQSLRRLGIETELVVYPGESHGIVRPSFQKDRLERYLAWFDSHLKGRIADPRSSESAQR